MSKVQSPENPWNSFLPTHPDAIHVTKDKLWTLDFRLWTLLFSCLYGAFKWNRFEVSHFLELVKACVDLLVSQFLNARSTKLLNIRSEERRVGKECRYRLSAY